MSPVLNHRLNSTAALRDGIKCHKVLSASAKALIQQETKAGRYEKLLEDFRAPFMPPSTHTDDYSQVGETVQLCT